MNLQNTTADRSPSPITMQHKLTTEEMLPTNYYQKREKKLTAKQVMMRHNFQRGIVQRMAKTSYQAKVQQIKQATLKAKKLSFKTLSKYNQEYGIHDEDEAADILGFYPNEDSVVPLDFERFKQDIAKKTQILHSLKCDKNFLEAKHNEVIQQKDEQMQEIVKTYVWFKDKLLNEVVRIQRWFRHQRSKKAFKSVLMQAQDIRKAKLRKFIAQIEGEIAEEDLERQKKEQEKIKKNNKAMAEAEQIRLAALAKRRATALAQFEKSLIFVVPTVIGKATVKHLKNINTQIYERDDVMHEDEARAQAEFDARVAKAKAMLMGQMQDMKFLADKQAQAMKAHADANFNVDALADIVKDVPQQKAKEKPKKPEPIKIDPNVMMDPEESSESPQQQQEDGSSQEVPLSRPGLSPGIKSSIVKSSVVDTSTDRSKALIDDQMSLMDSKIELNQSLGAKEFPQRKLSNADPKSPKSPKSPGKKAKLEPVKKQTTITLKETEVVPDSENVSPGAKPLKPEKKLSQPPASQANKRGSIKQVSKQESIVLKDKKASVKNTSINQEQSKQSGNNAMWQSTQSRPSSKTGLLNQSQNIGSPRAKSPRKTVNPSEYQGTSIKKTKEPASLEASQTSDQEDQESKADAAITEEGDLKSDGGPRRFGEGASQISDTIGTNVTNHLVSTTTQQQEGRSYDLGFPDPSKFQTLLPVKTKYVFAKKTGDHRKFYKPNPDWTPRTITDKTISEDQKQFGGLVPKRT